MKHDIIKTDNYLLIVDGSEIKAGDYHVATRIVKTNGDNAIALTDQKQLEAIAEIGGAKKIIAHLPLNQATILEGVDLLPPLEQEDDVELYYQKQVMQTYPVETQSYTAYEKGFIEGYKKAKEKYKYTEVDMKIAIQQAFLSGVERLEDFEKVEKMILGFIQSLSQTKYPIRFKCEMDCILVVLRLEDKCTIKTTTNSQGKTVWVGKYIY